MIRFFRKLLAGAAPPVSQEDEDLLRYPPWPKGLPAAPVDELLARQKDILDQLAAAMPVSQDEWRGVVMPVIRSYAAFVHLLPASEAHHHRGSGGLLRHGLEAAFFAAREAEATQWVLPMTTPSQRLLLEPRWRAAAAIGGLLHDIGKPYADVDVTDPDGNQWNPLDGSLAAWTEKVAAPRYFVRWRRGRVGEHDACTMVLMGSMLPQEFRAWLCVAGPDILAQLVETLARVREHPLLKKAIAHGDQTSVSHDVRVHAGARQNQVSFVIPAHEQVVAMMKRFIAQKRWTANIPGARVWHGAAGTFIIWRGAGARDLTDEAQARQTPGIPRDPDALARVLLDHNIASWNEVDGKQHPYWPILPAVLAGGQGRKRPHLAVRIIDPAMLFGDAVPAQTEIELIELGKPKAAPQTPPPDADPAPEAPQPSSEVPVATSAPAHPGDDEEVAAALPAPTETAPRTPRKGKLQAAAGGSDERTPAGDFLTWVQSGNATASPFLTVTGNTLVVSLRALDRYCAICGVPREHLKAALEVLPQITVRERDIVLDLEPEA